MDAKKLARLALLAAVSVIIVLLASIMPTGKLGLTACAGLAVAFAVVSGGIPGGLGCWAAASAISLLLAPQKGCAALFAIFFGLYPIVKSLIERLASLALEWILKVMFFLIVFFGWYIALTALFAPPAEGIFSLLPVLAIAGTVVFILYDIVFSKLIAIYLARSGSFLRRK